MKAIVVYYSRGGTTKEMAEIIHKELENCRVKTDLLSAEAVRPAQLNDYDAIIMGSPTYYGTLASPIKKLIDESVALHGKFDGKIGGAFSSAANLAGGNETTILSILQAFLIHGMLIQGDPNGDHYGPVAIGKVDDRCASNCREFARRLAALIERHGAGK